LGVVSESDGDGEGTADAFGVDRLGVFWRHRRPRDTLGRTPEPATDHGVTPDAPARHDAEAPIGVGARSDDVPGREGAVGVAYRQARHVGGAESVGASRDPGEDRVEVVALREVARDVGPRLRLASAAVA